MAAKRSNRLANQNAKTYHDQHIPNQNQIPRRDMC
jgi:hypothetical protein